jgi:hypothetical protein
MEFVLFCSLTERRTSQGTEVSASSPSNRSFDPLTLPQYVHFIDMIVVPREIYDRHCISAMPVLISPFSSAHYSGCVIVQSYRCSLSFITFRNLLNESSEIMGHKMKRKSNVGTGFLIRLVANRRCFKEPISVVKWGSHCAFCSTKTA